MIKHVWIDWKEFFFTEINLQLFQLHSVDWNWTAGMAIMKMRFWNLFLCLLQLKIQILEWTLGKEIQHIPVNLDRVKFSVVSSIDSYMSV